MTPERLAELGRLCAAATPGPWIAENAEVLFDGSPGNAWGVESSGVEQCIRKTVVEHDFVQKCDAKFIAAARTALPALLDEIARLTDHNARLEQVIEHRMRSGAETLERLAAERAKVRELRKEIRYVIDVQRNLIDAATRDVYSRALRRMDSLGLTGEEPT